MSPATRTPRGRALDLPEVCDVPQLAEILEPGRLSSALGDALAHAVPRAPDLLRCAVTKVHYRPGKGCRLVISARFRVGRSRWGVEQLYFGRLLSDASLRSRADASGWFETTGRGDMATPAFGPSSLDLRGWNLRLWAYPNDPELPGLPLLADPERVRARFAADPETFGFERPPRSVRGRRAKYVPCKRCGYVYDVSGWSARGRAPAKRIYGKCYARGAARVAHDAAWSVWHSPAARAGDVRLPRPFACDEAAGIVWQEGLAGRPIVKMRGQAARLPSLGAEIGSRLAALHGTGLPLPHEMDHEFQLEMLRESLASARASRTPSAEAATELGERLLAVGESLPELPAVTLHGSFRLSHVIATPEGIAFIDLDGANEGDPGVDLGRFLAHLRRLQVQGSITRSVADSTAREFCRGYSTVAPVRVSDRRIGWSTAVHLVSGALDKALRRVDTSMLTALTAAAAWCCP